MIYIIFFSIIALLLLILVIDTIRKKGKFGINLSLPNCPKCNEKAPPFRRPTSTRQGLWGGWTCSKCRCEMDKWGKEIIKNDETEISPKSLEQSKTNPINSFDEKGKTPVERVFEEKNN